MKMFLFFAMKATKIEMIEVTYIEIMWQIPKKKDFLLKKLAKGFWKKKG